MTDVNHNPISYSTGEIHFLPLSEYSSHDLSDIQALTFPSHFETLVTASDKKAPAKAMLALSGDSVVGLALCLVESQEANLLSIAVNASVRRRGVAGQLLDATEDYLHSIGISRIIATYTSSLTSYEALNALLASRSWQEPIPRILFVRGLIQRMYDEAHWLDKIVCPDDFEIFDWSELTAADRAQIEADMQAGTVPYELNPFYSEETLQLETSVGARCNGKIVGWQVTHPVPGENTVLRYSRTFLYPEYQGSGRGVILIKETILRQVERVIDRIPYYLADVAYERPPMVRFYKRNLIPYSEKTYSSYRSEKILND